MAKNKTQKAQEDAQAHALGTEQKIVLKKLKAGEITEAEATQAMKDLKAKYPLGVGVHPSNPPAAEQPKATEPKAEVKTPATPVPPSKQMQTIAKLTLAFKEQRQIEIVESMTKQDGKYILINIGAGWPVIRIGANGGVSLPEIRSYKEGMDTWMKADELLARQKSRGEKKAVAATPAAPKAAEPKQAVSA